ncbi:ABC transporter substrate-binding protein [Stackebrandtia sp.]|jgi:glycine betaine/proline transport system substrate-binding protein|uniref:ABC transporter substrate-binding protein n=1 Tax=Stackebrandtia sp. TaxID=2023065 RepID=UPI0039C91AA7
MRTKLIAMLGVGVMLTTSACAGAKSGAGAGDSKTVDFAINAWTGYEADEAVLKYLLENKLDYKVNEKNLKEEVAWQGFEDKSVDVVIENWGHDDLKKKYIDDKKVAKVAGDTGNVGKIGWYIPTWMVKKYPGIDNWKNLNKYAKDLKTSESGDKGQLLFGDESYVSNEKALIKNLHLDYKVVVGGSENALVEQAETSEKEKKPVLFYFWDPHWLFSKMDLTRVKLPKYSDDTKACPTAKDKVKCDYPEMNLDKVVSSDFAKNGGDAYKLIKNFKWTNEDQNEVSYNISQKHMDPEDAAKKWLDANESKWKAWMP